LDLLCALVEKAKEWGLVVHEGVGATGIRLEKSRVTAVQTEKGKIETPIVINAAGPWARQVGLWAGLNYSLQWSRESDLVFRVPDEFGGFPVVSDPLLRFYFRPTGTGGLLVGLGFPKEVEPLDINDYDQNLDPTTASRITEKLFERIPSLEPVYNSSPQDRHGYASIYTITDDWHPIVGPEPKVEGYYSFFGGSGHAFKLSPPIGESLAAMIMGESPKIDIDALRPGRFVDGEPLTSVWGSGNRA